MVLKKRFVLFDFDGVIADSFAIASALAQRACKKNTREVYRSAFEGNIYDSVRDREGSEGHGPECDHDLDWWGEYQKSFVTVLPFEGIAEVVTDLARSYSLVIVTSGSRRFIEPFLKENGLAEYFLDILDVDVHTHKTKKIEMLFDTYGLAAADCIFVTDTLGDIREAAHHSIGSIACAWGFHSKETLQRGEPFYIAEKPHEITTAVEAYFSSSSIH